MTPLRAAFSNPAPASCSAASILTAFAVALVNETLREDLELTARRGDHTEAVYDFVVVGAGAAGCVVAARLSEDSQHSVALLEAGGNEHPVVSSYGTWFSFVDYTDLIWDYRSEPHPTACGGSPNGCQLYAGKGLGGSSAVNGMQYVRGNPRDYDGWAARGNTGWGYKDVLPFFIKSENNSGRSEDVQWDRHGHEGPLPVQSFPLTDPVVDVALEGLRDLGLQKTDVNGDMQVGYTVFQSTVRNGRRVSANTAFLQPAIGRKNLHVQTRAHVTKVLLDPDNRAYAVQYRDVDGKIRTVRARKEVILSSGALRSPQILMLSGIGPAQHLKHHGIPVRSDLPVGESFQDMPIVVPGIRFSLPPDLHNPASGLDKMLHDLTSYLQPERRGPFAANLIRRAIAFFDADDPLNSTHPNIQLRFETARASPTPEPEGCEHPIGLEVYHDSITALPILMGSESHGSVQLRSTDPFAAPVVHENLYGAPSDIKRMVRALKFVASLNDTNTFRTWGVSLDPTGGPPLCSEKHEFASDAYWECFAKSRSVPTGHYSSTCPMGPVVDHLLQVHNVTNLRVVDASIMPFGPRASTYASSLMIGEKGADLIKQKWRP